MVDGRTKTGKVVNRLKTGSPQAAHPPEIRTPIADDIYMPNLSGISSHPEAKSNFVPYTNALFDVDIGDNDLSTTDTVNAGVVEIPTTSSTTGQITQNGSSLVHTYGTQNFFVGGSAGNFTNTANNCVGLGQRSMPKITSSQNSLALGAYSNYDLTSANGSVAIGTFAGFEITTGDSNICVGRNSGVDLTPDSSDNTFVGAYSGDSSQKGTSNMHGNVAIGRSAMGAFVFDGNANRNTIIGYHAGKNIAGSYNIMIGNTAGENEAGSHKLYIHSSNTATPLIYGEFDNNFLKINGSFRTAMGRIIHTNTVTDTYTALITDHLIIANKATAFTITLPASVDGQELHIKNINTGAVTVDGDSGETIDGAATKVLSSQYDSVTIIGDGSNWHII